MNTFPVNQSYGIRCDKPNVVSYGQFRMLNISEEAIYLNNSRNICMNFIYKLLSGGLTKKNGKRL